MHEEYNQRKACCNNATDCDAGPPTQLAVDDLSHNSEIADFFGYLPWAFSECYNMFLDKAKQQLNVITRPRGPQGALTLASLAPTAFSSSLQPILLGVVCLSKASLCVSDHG